MHKGPSEKLITNPGRPASTHRLSALLLLCVLALCVTFAQARGTYQPGETFYMSADQFATATEETAEISDAKPREMVFLLHGIAKGKLDMAAMARRLRHEGYAVVNWSYPSTQLTICEIADQLAEEVARFPNYKIHFVTHSMGGIVVRTFFSRHEIKNPGRLVMIAPPSQGAELAQLLGNWGLYQYILGPAGQELRPGDLGKCASAGIPPVDFGIIAGGTGLSMGINPLLAGDNDGTVTVESTKLDGAQDFALVPYPHPVIQMMPRTADLTVNFLQTGRFN